MIWIAGSHGSVGRELARQLVREGIAFVGTGRGVDLTRRSSIRDFLRSRPKPPRWIIDCAGCGDTERAQKEPDEAFAVNGYAARNLAEAAREVGASLLYVSCAEVFGSKNGPHTEGETPRPDTLCGLSKLCGENFVRRILPRHIILRTSWLYGTGGKGLVNTALNRLRAAAKRQEVPVDHVGSPTFAADVAEAMVRMISGAALHYGTFHLANGGTTSHYELAWALYVELLNRGAAKGGISIEPVSLGPPHLDRQAEDAEAPGLARSSGRQFPPRPEERTTAGVTSSRRE